MENVMNEITSGVYGFAFWQEELHTYTNCYLIKDDKGYILLDTVRKEHSEELINMLKSLDVDPVKIHTVVATHGHCDHIANIGLFANSDKYIHINDLNLVPNENRNSFKVLNGKAGAIEGLEWRLSGGHTPGSIVLFEKGSKVLFIGDIVCFAGTSLTSDGLVSEAQEYRELWHEFIASGGFAENLSEEGQNIEVYINSIKNAAGFDAEYLCSGHGTVLEHDIPLFLNSLFEILKSNEKK